MNNIIPNILIFVEEVLILNEMMLYSIATYEG